MAKFADEVVEVGDYRVFSAVGSEMEVVKGRFWLWKKIKGDEVREARLSGYFRRKLKNERR